MVSPLTQTFAQAFILFMQCWGYLLRTEMSSVDSLLLEAHFIAQKARYRLAGVAPMIGVFLACLQMFRLLWQLGSVFELPSRKSAWLCT